MTAIVEPQIIRAYLLSVTYADGSEYAGTTEDESPYAPGRTPWFDVVNGLTGRPFSDVTLLRITGPERDLELDLTTGWFTLTTYQDAGIHDEPGTQITVTELWACPTLRSVPSGTRLVPYQDLWVERSWDISRGFARRVPLPPSVLYRLGWDCITPDGSAHQARLGVL